MVGTRMALMTALGGCAALILAGCDNGPSAVARNEGDAPRAFADRAPQEPAAREGRSDRSEAALKVDGKAMWAATRRYSAEEAAQRGFERNGADFGAKDVDAYVRKAHAFVSDPPAGVETLARPNGDTLYYDAKANIFAVADKDGLPKTMFKPDDGAKYWADQKDRDARRQTARRSAPGGEEG